jgi:hypothetical protein
MFTRYDFLKWNILDILPVDDNRCIHICDSHGKLKGCDEYRNQVITDIVFNNEGKIRACLIILKTRPFFQRAHGRCW